MDGENIVQPAVVPEGTPAITPEVAPATPVTPEVKAEAKPETQPLTQEQVSKMVQESVALATETAKREIQSIKDKARAEVEQAYRRSQLAETTLNQVRGKLKEADPTFAQELEIAELRTKDQHYQQREAEDMARQQQAQFDNAFKNNLTQFITGLGADPKDPRVDWGEDAKDYLEKQNRILNSVVKLQKEDTKKTEDKRSQEVKDIEIKLRKELGLDSVDTTQPVAGPSLSANKADLNKAYANGDISWEKYQEGLRKF
jgi:uncharacterized membrane-anchored protein YjiN (DUF445 family)